MSGDAGSGSVAVPERGGRGVSGFDRMRQEGMQQLREARRRVSALSRSCLKARTRENPRRQSSAMRIRKLRRESLLRILAKKRLLKMPKFPFRKGQN